MFKRIIRNMLVKLMWIIENSRDLDDKNMKCRLQSALAETAEFVEQNRAAVKILGGKK